MAGRAAGRTAGRTGRAALAGVLGVALAIASAGPAAGAWTAPGAVSPDGVDGLVETLAVDDAGDALVTWIRRTVAPSSLRVQVRQRSAAGVLGPVLTVSPATAAASGVRAGLSAGGDAWIGWQAPDAALDVRLQARRLSRAGVLGPVLAVSPAGTGSLAPQLAVDPAGNAVFAWLELGPTPAVWSRRVDAAGAAGPLRPLTRVASRPQDLALHAYPDGTVLAVWADGPRLLARMLDGTGVPGPLRVLYAAPSPNDSVTGPSVTVDGAGQALIGWRRLDSTTLLASGMARTASPALVLGPVRRVTPAAQDVTMLLAGSDAGGNRVLLWSDWTTGNTTQARRLTAAGTLGPVTVLGTGYPRAVALGRTGAGAVAWEGPSADRAFNHTVWTAAVTPGAGGPVLGPAVELRRGAELPAAAASGLGQVLLTFQQPGTAWIRTWLTAGP